MNPGNAVMHQKKRELQVAQTGLLLGMALVFQIFFARFMQPVVGPLVNMTLILSVLMVGKQGAMMIGFMTPMLAYILGIMPLFPVVPLVILGNTTYVLLFDRTQRINGYVAVVISALGKFGVMTLGIQFVVPLFLPQVPSMITTAFMFPQLYTALIGGGFALLLYKKIPHKG
ncbi:ECF transporter S component [Isachenkonia alkalipeptolytica]|uniref:ECF transporter S component n=1 Tax=Isachenkonia alkalipeptolytica TaxID=2565777 RepID=A0AA43XMH9_9CLOT|nr:ECF transporter S component [Isachenkonia alkalipeptolytica]NBG89287.1 ECF transporter S component [Isachenkonia alkalipeptolytica]